MQAKLSPFGKHSNCSVDVQWQTGVNTRTRPAFKILSTFEVGMSDLKGL